MEEMHLQGSKIQLYTAGDADESVGKFSDTHAFFCDHYAATDHARKIWGKLKIDQKNTRKGTFSGRGET